MQLVILGLPQSGKSTLFNALTRGNAPIGDFGAKAEVHRGVAHVPDKRLDKLTAMFKPRRTVCAEVAYVDLPPPPPGSTDSIPFGGDALQHLQKADGIVQVVRAFENDAVPHPKGSVDWERDLKDLMFDLLFADIALLDRRIERINVGMKSLRAADRDLEVKKVGALRVIQHDLEQGTPLRDRKLNDIEQRALQDTFLVSALPFLIALNIGEDDLNKADELERAAQAHLSGAKTGAAVICGSLEMDLMAMSNEEESDFRESLGAGESGLQKMIGLSYDVLGLCSFLTVGEDEVRAWTIEKGTPAAKAAGRVHSDIERGFIRAEVVGYEDLVAAGNLPSARKAGTLRSEGRDYVMRDGDVVNFLFSV